MKYSHSKKTLVLDRISKGQLCGIVAAQNYYPDYLNKFSAGKGTQENLTPTFDDSMQRMIWRTQQNWVYIKCNIHASLLKFFDKIMSFS